MHFNNKALAGLMIEGPPLFISTDHLGDTLHDDTYLCCIERLGLCLALRYDVIVGCHAFVLENYMEEQQLAQQDGRGDAQATEDAVHCPEAGETEAGAVQISQADGDLFGAREADDKQVHPRRKLNHDQDTRGGDQRKEGPVVLPPDAVVEPFAVVIKTVHASITRAAMLALLLHVNLKVS